MAGRRQIRDAGAVAERPDVRVTLDAENLVDPDAAAAVEWQAQPREGRMSAHAGCPDERAGRDLLPVGECGGVRFEELERRPDPDLDAALRQLPGGVVAEAGRDLREDRRRRVDENPPLPHSGELWVEAQGVADKVAELGERLDSGVARPDEDKGQLPLSVALCARGRGGLEAAQYVISQLDRVLERLEAEGVLLQSGDRQRARHGAEGDHELVVADGDQLFLGSHPDGLMLEVER